jgi:hypothetical protein
VHEREKKKKKKTVSERNLIRRRSLSALREPPRRLDKAAKWAKNSEKEKSKKVLPTGSLS